jgi:hypothetical protein
MAASHGKGETNRLKTQVEEQLNRLLTQLFDLETLRDDLDDDEYQVGVGEEVVRFLRVLGIGE